MTQTYFFQYNVPADNHPLGRTDEYVDMVCKCDGRKYGDGTLIVNVLPVITHAYDLIVIKDWNRAIEDIKRIARKHFEGVEVDSYLADVMIQSDLS